MVDFSMELIMPLWPLLFHPSSGLAARAITSSYLEVYIWSPCFCGFCNFCSDFLTLCINESFVYLSDPEQMSYSSVTNWLLFHLCLCSPMLSHAWVFQYTVLCIFRVPDHSHVLGHNCALRLFLDTQLSSCIWLLWLFKVISNSMSLTALVFSALAYLPVSAIKPVYLFAAVSWEALCALIILIIPVILTAPVSAPVFYSKLLVYHL